MSKLANFILGIKRPKRLMLLSLVSGILAAIFEIAYLLKFDTGMWLMTVAVILILASINLIIFYQFVCWAQTAHLLDKCYHDLRQYEIMFDNMKLHAKSTEACQKVVDRPQFTLETFIEWIQDELKFSEERLKLMEDAKNLIQNELNNSRHD